MKARVKRFPRQLQQVRERSWIESSDLGISIVWFWLFVMLTGEVLVLGGSVYYLNLSDLIISSFRKQNGPLLISEQPHLGM